MGLPRTKLERQLQLCSETLQARTKMLDEKGVEPKQRGLDPKWRTLNAECRQIRRRLKAADAVVALDKELKQRKTEQPVGEEE